MTPELAAHIEADRRASAARPLGAGALAQWFAVAWTGLSLAAGVTLLLRRLAGAAEVPLSWQAMLLTGIALTAAATAARAAWPVPSDAALRRWTTWLGPVVVSAGVLAVGAALSVPGTGLAGLVPFWIMVAAEELWAFRATVRGVRASVLSRRPGGADAGQGRGAAASALAGRWRDLGETADDVLQQQIRSRAADGTEVVRGWLRVPLASGQRSASVHVAFCPPFCRAPRVEVEQQEGPAARIKTVQLLPHGARFDLKLNQPVESAGFIVLEFSAAEATEG